jgi:hypothetical protein
LVQVSITGRMSLAGMSARVRLCFGEKVIT